MMHGMFFQIALGSGLILLTLGLGAITLPVIEWLLMSWRRWLLQEPHWPKTFAVVMAAGLWALGMIGAGIWMWAALFVRLSVFPDWEAAVYFALESFTTLGFGDLIPPVRWRILAGMAAANGLLNFGLITAVLVEGVRDLRLRQSRPRPGRR